MNNLQIKRIYEKPLKTDGCRILVDRLWPRGEAKTDAHIDLRKWFNHEPEKFKDFSKKYTEELKHNSAVNQIIDILKNKNVSLIYAAKDEHINHAVVLRDFILKKL